jgi:hypothetical protein
MLCDCESAAATVWWRVEQRHRAVRHGGAAPPTERECTHLSLVLRHVVV